MYLNNNIRRSSNLPDFIVEYIYTRLSSAWRLQPLFPYAYSICQRPLAKVVKVQPVHYRLRICIVTLKTKQGTRGCRNHECGGCKCTLCLLESQLSGRNAGADKGCSLHP